MAGVALCGPTRRELSTRNDHRRGRSWNSVTPPARSTYPAWTLPTRTRYLVQSLFAADEITAVYTHHDRVVLAGARPATKALTLGTLPEIRSDYFLEHREAGIVNVGGAGTVTADGTEFELRTGACLYVGRGVREVVFASSARGGLLRGSTSSRLPRTPLTHRACRARRRATVRRARRRGHGEPPHDRPVHPRERRQAAARSCSA